MTEIGVNSDLQVGMMDPICRDIRLTETCKYWILDTVSARYASLREIQAASKNEHGLLVQIPRDNKQASRLSLVDFALTLFPSIRIWIEAITLKIEYRANTYIL